MPLITLTLHPGKPRAYKTAILSAVHAALVASGVPQKDRFHRVLELGPDDFQYDGEYPDLATSRTADFVVIEILFSVGRSVKVKKKIIADLMAGLARDPGLDPEHVLVVFKETAWENWAFGGGRLIHT